MLMVCVHIKGSWPFSLKNCLRCIVYQLISGRRTHVVLVLTAIANIFPLVLTMNYFSFFFGSANFEAVILCTKRVLSTCVLGLLYVSGFSVSIAQSIQ
jgi:hypothetical protein